MSFIFHTTGIQQYPKGKRGVLFLLLLLFSPRVGYTCLPSINGVPFPSAYLHDESWSFEQFGSFLSTGRNFAFRVGISFLHWYTWDWTWLFDHFCFFWNTNFNYGDLNFYQKGGIKLKSNLSLEWNYVPTIIHTEGSPSLLPFCFLRGYTSFVSNRGGQQKIAEVHKQYFFALNG